MYYMNIGGRTLCCYGCVFELPHRKRHKQEYEVKRAETMVSYIALGLRMGGKDYLTVAAIGTDKSDLELAVSGSPQIGKVIKTSWAEEMLKSTFIGLITKANMPLYQINVIPNKHN